MNGPLAQTTFTILAAIGTIISLGLSLSKNYKIALYAGSSFVMVISGVVIIGYLYDMPLLYTYPQNRIPMAFTTACCLFVLGLCVFVIAFTFQRNAGNRRKPIKKV